MSLAPLSAPPAASLPAPPRAAVPVRASRRDTGLALSELAAEVGDDLRASWARGPGWLGGMALNLVLACGYLLWTGVDGSSATVRAMVIGSCLVSFLLSDTAGTNLLGADRDRVRDRLGRGVPLRRILLVKNLTLLLVAGTPVLAVSTVITLTGAPVADLAVVLPAVLLPMSLLLGLGNLASVVCPVAPASLAQRWRGRSELRSTLCWLAGLGASWTLWVAVDPVSDALEKLESTLGSVGLLDSLTFGGALLLAGLLGRQLLTTAAVVLADRRNGLADRLGG